MTHRGHRSPEGLQRQAVRKLVFNQSRRDRIQERKYLRYVFSQYLRYASNFAENINLLSREQIVEELSKQFDGVVLCAVKFERGEVLMDSRGRGSLQQLPKDKNGLKHALDVRE